MTPLRGIALVLLLIAAALPAPSRAERMIRGREHALGHSRPGLLGLPPFNSVWEASSGNLPDSTCPAWISGVSDSTPKFTGGALRIHTTAFSGNAYFLQADTSLVIPDTLVVEARLRFEMGTEFIGPCGHYRQAAMVAVNVAGSTGILFFVGNDEIFMPTGGCSGITRVVTPTRDAAHTYRVEVANGSGVRVYRDGVLALTGNTYSSVPDHGTVPRILWGEGSSLTYGTTFWESVKHNAHAVGCPATGVSAYDPFAPIAGGNSLHALPNPSNEATRLAWTLAKRAHVRVGVFDMSGRFVRSIHEGTLPAGSHSAVWDGRDAGGRRSPPGVYLCRAVREDGVEVARVVRTR